MPTNKKHAFDDDLTPERVKYIEAQWKSDIDRKVDALVEFAATYQDFLKLLITREEKRARLRDAIIEKSLMGALWAAVLFVGAMILTGIKAEYGDFRSALDAATVKIKK